MRNTNSWRLLWFLNLGTATSGVLIVGISCAKAQITPDATLPNNSRVTTQNNIRTIEGGTQAGRNLFHSFSEFSVPTGSTAYFNNAVDIQNIISRVTGGSVSNIYGIIQAKNPVNLFLINPNGIVFGQGAQLQVGGSFFASTASSINFADGTKFSANPSQTTPLLTISVPVGLQFGGTVNPITVQGSSLEVASGKTLALVGGDVSFNGGTLTAPNGRVELGAIASAGTVGLNLTDNNPSLSFPDLVQRANISFNGTNINVTDRSQGSVAVTGHNIDILQKSMISAGIGTQPGLTAVGSSPGNIDINATGAVTINQASRLSNQVAAGDTGSAGNINIKAGEISITNQDSSLPTELNAALITEPKGIGRAGDISLESNGSITLIGQSLNPEDKVISTYSQSGGLGGGNISLTAKGSISLDNAFLVSSAFGGGPAGNILLQGDESISMVNNSSLVATNFVKGNSGNITLQSNGPISLRTSMVSTNIGTTLLGTTPVPGNGGNIDITGQSVYVTDGALVTSRSSTSGNAGNIQINAKELVELSGTGPFPPPDGFRVQTQLYSSLTTSAEQEARGSAGTISITTGTLKLSDGANIRADSKSAFSGGNGGNIIIDANVIDLTGGGQIFTTTSDVGNAGKITLNVTDRITISGTNPSFADAMNQAQAGGYDIGSIDSASGIFANTSGTSIGNGGNLSINTGQLFVQDGAKVTVSSSGSGNAGNLGATARLIQLDQGTISADTQGGKGNINLHSSGLILGHGSNITAKARGSDVRGGNINIDTDVLAAVENSKISADSLDFRGGKVGINAQSIFLSPDSSITARGVNQELNGTVQIISPEIDPSRGLVILPMVTENTPRLVSSNCEVFNETTGGSSFTVTGRGGLPPSPYEPLSSDVVWSDARLPAVKLHNSETRAVKLPFTPKPEDSTIVPATGWVFNSKGEVKLISSASNTTGVGSTPTPCLRHAR